MHVHGFLDSPFLEKQDLWLLARCPGGKVRAISRGVLARGDIARDPARLRQIPWFRVRYVKARSDGITRDLACI